MVKAIIIAIAIIWALFITYLSIMAILVGYKNDKEIEAIESWYPFCELMKIKIPKDDGKGGAE